MQTLWHLPAITMIAGYILGSIPFGLLLTRIAGAGDLRQIGSGNIGATNVLRTGNKSLAAATLLLDMAKGAVAVLVGAMLSDGSGSGAGWDGAMIAGAMAFIGHCYPVWLRFAGGKGVATLMGVTAALAWPVGLVFALTWLLALFIFRWSSLGGMLAGISAPISALLFGRPDLALPFAAMALILLWRHRQNISRLLRGAEPKIGAGKG